MKSLFFVFVVACQMPRIIRPTGIDGDQTTETAGPLITSVTGNSARQPGRIDTGIVISGERLGNGMVRLLDHAGSAIAELTVARADASSIEALLPMTLGVGEYTLEVANSGGVARQAVQILRGEQGPPGPPGAPGQNGMNGMNGMPGATGSGGGSNVFNSRIQVGGVSGLGQGNVQITNGSADYARISMWAGASWNYWDIAAGGQATDGLPQTADFSIYHADQDGNDYNVLTLRGDGAMTVRGPIRSVGGNVFNGGANGFLPIVHIAPNTTCATVCANHGYACTTAFRLSGGGGLSTCSASSGDPANDMMCYCSSF